MKVYKFGVLKYSSPLFCWGYSHDTEPGVGLPESETALLWTGIELESGDTLLDRDRKPEERSKTIFRKGIRVYK